MSASEAVVHVGFLPSAGMGHLNPCLRLAAVFLRQGCKVTLITPKPTVSMAESDLITRFCSSFPHQVTQVDFNPVPLDPTTVSTNIDPFYLQFQTIRHSIHLLLPILSSLATPLSAFIYNVSLISAVVSISDKLSCPSYIYFTSSARMLSFIACVSVLADSDPAAQPHPSRFIGDAVQVPGFTSPIPRSSVPQAFLLEGSNSFQRMIMEDSRNLTKLDGVLINSFEELEGEALAALNEGKVVRGLPPVYGIGPLMACEFENVNEGQKNGMSWILEWLDEQAEGSVVYVSLGSRTETRREQIKDTALGLIECGYSFLWVVKLKRVDREEDEGLEDVLGSELMGKVKERGVVVKEYVNQMKILGHPAVGGFVSHGGWNSITETLSEGVPILTWPQYGDQKMTSEAIKMSGVGIWAEEWGWGTQKVVEGKEIAKKIKEMMTDESLRVKAGEMKEAARKACGVGGSCELIIKRLIEEWKRNAQVN
ncbi:hypothetical protein LR48_Vigan10g050200 [Vigna angularis]|uniref:Glycosyltransferase n=2 Tax=Phaseolus angularis TaxID=3914 RepID=A0A0L9VHR6_PHAAN|nr:UDP-glycosyltransferase 708D1 [Vigna angularis]KOM54610.1 hypothetical protein LR48_Vigan10g050200 [Vigna angularis]